ncbi:MAG: hypothetical protein VX941_10270 [Pseudomonadota bacterium]|nr:hypothetical protein [Pseudomonadota bacterium]
MSPEPYINVAIATLSVALLIKAFQIACITAAARIRKVTATVI